jgi:hypothetical protein
MVACQITYMMLWHRSVNVGMTCLNCSLSFVSGSVGLGLFFFLSAKCCEINPLNVAHLLILSRLT